ncbi:hypothetical protein GW916_05555 [bacterium]|nr:hypothetical protein [bacterium]
MKTSLSFFILIALTILTSGCHVGKKELSRPNEGPVEERGEENAWSPSPSQVDSNFEFSEAFFGDKSNHREPDFSEGLTQKSSEILNGDKNQYLKFKELLLSGCEGVTLRNCRYLGLFSRSSLSSKVIAMNLSIEKDLLRKRQLILAAFEVANAQPHSKLVAEALSFSTDYLLRILIVEDGELKIRKGFDQSLKSHIRFSEMIFREVSKGKATEEQLQSILQWIPLTTKANANEVLGSKLIHFISAALSSNRGHPLAEQALVSLVSNTKTNFEFSFSVFDRKSSGKALALTESQKMARFFVDHIANDQEKSARILAPQGFDFSSSEVAEAIETWVKKSIEFQAMDSHRKMGKFIRDFETQNQSVDKLFREVLLYSKSDIEPTWARLLTAVIRLKHFSLKEMDNKTLFKLKETFSKVPKNIYYLSSYPQMIGLALYARKLDFRQSISFGPLLIQLSDEKFFSHLMSGEAPNLFNYASSYEDNKLTANLDQIEVRIAWSYFYQLGIYSHYNMTVEESLDLFSQGFLKDFSSQLKLVDFEISQTAGSEGVKESGRVCALISKAQNGESVPPLFRKRKLSELKSQVFFGLGRESSSFPISDLYSFTDLTKAYLHKSLDEQVESIRVLIRPWREDFQSLVHVAEEKTGRPLSSQRGEIEKLRSFEERTLAKARGMANLASTCLPEVALIEKRQRRNLLGYEIQYLDQVSELGNKIRSKELSPAQANQLLLGKYYSKALVANEDFIKDFLSYSGFFLGSDGSAHFIYRPIDFILRVAFALEKGFPGQLDRVSFSYGQSQSGLLRLVGDLTSTPLVGTQLKLDESLTSRALEFLKEKLTEGDRSTKASFWINDEETFVSTIRNLNRTDAALIKASESSGLSSKLESVLRRNKKAAEFFNIDPQDQEIFQILKQPSFLDDQKSPAPLGLFYDVESAQTLALLDDFYVSLVAYSYGLSGRYRGILSTEQVWDSSPDELNTEIKISVKPHHFAKAQGFFKSLRDYSRRIIIPLDGEAAKLFIQRSGEAIYRDLKIEKNFWEWVNLKSNKVEWESPLHFSLRTRASLSSPLVQPSVRRAYMDQVESFHDQTLGVFRSQ